MEPLKYIDSRTFKSCYVRNTIVTLIIITNLFYIEETDMFCEKKTFNGLLIKDKSLKPNKLAKNKLVN